MERGERCQAQYLHLVDAGLSLGVRDAPPDLQGPLEVPAGLGGREPGHRLPAGLHRRRQRPRQVVGGVPVDGERGGHRCVVAGQPRVAVEGLGVGRVQLGALAGKQVFVDGVPGQGVPERVAAARAVDDEQKGVDGLAQGS